MLYIIDISPNQIDFILLLILHSSRANTNHKTLILRNFSRVHPASKIRFYTICLLFFLLVSSSLHVLLVRIGESTQGDGIHAIRARELAARQTGYLQPSRINFKRERRFRNLPLLLLLHVSRLYVSRFQFLMVKRMLLKLQKTLREIDIEKLRTIF